MDLLEKGSAWLEGQRHKHCTRPVTYVRGLESATLQATVGRTLFEQVNGFGITEKYETRDFLVLAADLILGGTPALPMRGDKISEQQGTQIFTYEVMAPGSEPEWRYSDAYRQTLRIHTKQVGVETIP